MRQLLHAHVHLLTAADFDVRTRDTHLTPLLVAASYNRKNAVLWLLQDGRDRINVDATNCEGRNAVHLACLDLQCQYTIEVSWYCGSTCINNVHVHVQYIQ